MMWVLGMREAIEHQIIWRYNSLFGIMALGFRRREFIESAAAKAD